MIEVFQAEWCPHSAKVRMKLTELGVDFVSRQVPAEGEDRAELQERTGQEGIPAVVLDDGTVLAGEDADIIAGLEERFTAWSQAGPHRRKDDEH
ncbi:MAG: glutaredoxin [Thermoleophilaceae bacterium]|nr:glutaredoxin [Thermoleophilaceae bacterium]